jgi:hypothetical protein
MSEQRSGFPEWVPREDRPDPTPETVPDGIVEHALEVGTQYAACPDCDTEQWFPWTPDEPTDATCEECGQNVTIV